MTHVLVWASRYGSIDVRQEDDLDSAIRSAGWAREDGSEYLDCIEVWDDDGHRVIPREEVFARWHEIKRAEAAKKPSPVPLSAKVILTSPAKQQAVLDFFRDRDEAEQQAEALRSVLGADRVKVISLA